ncbi:MAG: response regulator transcription factor [Dehalococcoidia bacterium]|jgi:two-component system response regulator MprA
MATGKSREADDQPIVLLVDDDERLLGALRRGLTLRSFQVDAAANADEALSRLQSRRPDVIVLDIVMPGMDGLSLCRLVRDRYTCPILMLTARDAVPDRVAGLEAGADDYLVKPFDLQELVARLRALLRRAGAESEPPEIVFGDLVLEPQRWLARRAGEPLALTATEFRLLELFMRSPGHVLTREDILASLRGDEWLGTESNIVDVHVGNLRLKLEAGGRPRIIKTVRGVGYALGE